jgi:ubiquinone/menaquinone biosynthesis C-methylase UbiE
MSQIKQQRPRHSDYGSGVMSRHPLFIAFHRLRFRPVYAVIVEHLKSRPGERVLDAGAGLGFLARRIAQSGAIVVCLDPDAFSLAVARKSLTRGWFEFIDASAEQLPLPDASLDAAVASFTAHHWSDRAAGFTEIARVLRPEGRFVLAEFRPGGWLVRLWRKMTTSKHQHVPDFFGWKAELESAGFREVSTVTSSPAAQLSGLFVSARR